MKFTMKYILFITLVQVTWCVVCSYRILMTFTTPAKSHYNIGMAIAKSLVDAGNDVTVISSYRENNLIDGKYRNIFLEGLVEKWFEILKIDDDSTSVFDLVNQSPFENNRFLIELGFIMANLTIEHSAFKEFLKSNGTFDVVILEELYSDALKSLGCHFNAPVIGFSAGAPNAWVNSAIGNPWPPSYVPDVNAGFQYPMNIWERFWNTAAIVYRDLSFHIVHIPQQNALMKKHFPHCPDLSIVAYNVSLFFLNGHESYSQPMPYFPNMINIGGIHMKSEQKLPQGLQDFMDNATKGVVYFSMGTFLNVSKMTSDVKQIFINVFKNIDVQVLWKWDNERLFGLSRNVKLGKWFPQQAVLAHPNLKVFITHAGIGSIMEAVRYGVPILTLPVFADQNSNAVYAEHLGYAINIPFKNIDEKKLLRALNDLLNNSKYREKARERSALFMDRPMKPNDSVVYWTEFVIRNRGGSHLRVASVDMPYYEYFLIDIIVYLIFTISVIFLCLHFIIKRLVIRMKLKQA
nr:UDP-glucuronosyltransferase 2B7-like [Leptinotarsa decemlineata]